MFPYHQLRGLLFYNMNTGSLTYTQICVRVVHLLVKEELLVIVSRPCLNCHVCNVFVILSEILWWKCWWLALVSLLFLVLSLPITVPSIDLVCYCYLGIDTGDGQFVLSLQVFFILPEVPNYLTCIWCDASIDFVVTDSRKMLCWNLVSLFRMSFLHQKHDF